jgi:hypothetical protein
LYEIKTGRGSSTNIDRILRSHEIDKALIEKFLSSRRIWSRSRWIEKKVAGLRLNYKHVKIIDCSAFNNKEDCR